jgi:putative transposase
MGRKKAHTPEEIVAKLRQVEVLAAQGKAVAEAARSIGVSEQTYATSRCGPRCSTRSGKRRC